ncbi:hypothetical protein K2173_015065 [Erythroxylum novogranatense]|uniref:Inhibitor I9 domain-containing protein n=1 Tax=Erythroxylum novogranatense TaxID=1862640 RepID=A0AAV8T2A6_9ROSI|nr:hypothetical protein K2173_015065 [Erythroxylum novogranatense]
MRIIKKSLHLLSLVIFLATIVLVDMADTTPTTATTADSAAVHIVYMERPEGEEEPEAYHIRTLTSVLGSEDAAKEALIYSYKNAASGFSAKLTAAQVEQMSSKFLYSFIPLFLSSRKSTLFYVVYVNTITFLGIRYLNLIHVLVICLGEKF